MYVRSDDGVKVWLNDELVWVNHAIRSLTSNEDIVKVKLKKGINHLLLKVTQGIGDWGYEVRFGLNKKLINSGWRVIHPFDNVGNIGFNTDNSVEIRAGGNLQINADASRSNGCLTNMNLTIFRMLN